LFNLARFLNLKDLQFMKKVYSGIIAFLLLSTLAYSQQDPQFSQYMFNNMGMNPAFAGMNEAICANLFHRQQWVGFEGRPITTEFTGDNFFRILHGGIGLTVLQDKIAQFSDLDIKLSYAYHINDLGPGKLSIGLQGGFYNKKTDFSQFKPIDDSDPILSSKDNQSAMALDLGFGAFYQVKDKWYAGISALQLIQGKEKFASSTFDLARHYYITGGYHYSLEDLGLSGFVITPSTLIKTDATSLQIDINAMVDYNNKFWAGLSYRKTDAIVIMLGIKPFGPGVYENLKVGYSYDITTSAMGGKGKSSGSHEIYLGYCFKIEVVKQKESYKNPRFL
jgi:type IX secretion system PorP/SprF family membrane protein